MCAIAGIYAYHQAANPVDMRELNRIREHMQTRGPDSNGQWSNSNHRIGLAHNRLAVIDLSNKAAQPMTSTDGCNVITFNGEIYNFKTLRLELEQKGYRFRTNCDTEVLLQLYKDKGTQMVRGLRGMFAFAIWDAEKNGLFLARDAYGIKPLYFSDDGRQLRFASQAKALLAGGGINTTTDTAGWAGFYLFGAVPEPFTVYRQIKALEPGTTLWIDNKGKAAPKRYFSLSTTYLEAGEVAATQRNHDAQATQETIREALLDSVRHHLVADVPVGAFLSAGVDSGALVGLMRDAGQDDIRTVTLNFAEFRGQSDDEAPLAAKVAKFYGTSHSVRTVTQNEFEADLPKILAAMDQPSVDGINSWFVAKAARELGLKVAVSGLGGDELFAGYSSFQDIPRWVNRTALFNRIPLLAASFQTAIRGLGKTILRMPPKLPGLLSYGGTYPNTWFLRRALFMPWDLPALMGTDMAQAGLERLQPLSLITKALPEKSDNPYAIVACLESSLYMRHQLLRDTDWASMAHSLEVRVPLVDVPLLQKVAPVMITQGRSMTSLSKAFLAKSPTLTLPDEIVRRRKTGFSTPMARWMKRSILNRANPIPAILQGPHVPWARKWAWKVAHSFNV